MNYRFLSLIRLFRHKFIPHRSKKSSFIHGKKNTQIAGYMLVQDLTPKEAIQAGRVGLYKDENGQEVVVKRHFFDRKDLDYEFLWNEASTLFLLNSLKRSGKTLTPRMIDVIETDNSISVVTEKMPGKMLELKDIPEAINKLSQCINFLRETTPVLAKKTPLKLLKKSSVFFLTVFPFYFFKNILSSPLDSLFFINQMILFYTKYNRVSGAGEKLVLSHTELYPDSILYDKKSDTVSLIDWEGTILADEFYDIALTARYYFDSFKKENLVEYLSGFIKTKKDLNCFMGLAIFTAMESLSTRQSRSYLNFVKRFLKFVGGLQYPLK